MTQGSLIGRVLNGKYRLVKMIGTGGMGTIYEGMHEQLEKRVAIKVLHRQIATNEEAYQRFLREARAAGRLPHPNIIEVTDFDRTSDTIPYMVMEYLEGEDLGSVLDREGCMTVGQILPIFQDVCSAVQCAHDAGIIHRDLKPENIFLCQFGGRTDYPKVLDFGISKVRDVSLSLTRTESYLGTPYYMSPEQARGQSALVDGRTDIFALGAMLYRALAGQYPFTGDSIDSILYQIVHEDPTPLQEENGQVSEALAEVIHRALAKAPDERFPSMDDLSAALSLAVEQSGEVKELTPVHEGDNKALLPEEGDLQEPSWSDPTVPAGDVAENVDSSPAISTGSLPPGLSSEDLSGLHPVMPDRSPPVRPINPPAAEEERVFPTISTLSASAGEHFRPSRRRRPRRDNRAAVIVLVVLLLVAGVGAFAYLRHSEKPVAPPQVAAGDPPSVASAPQKEQAAGQAPKQPPPATAKEPVRVRVSLKNLPARAVVSLDGELLTGNPLLVEQSTSVRRLLVKGSKGGTFSAAFTPHKDQVLVVKLINAGRSGHKIKRPLRGHKPPPKPLAVKPPAPNPPKPPEPKPVVEPPAPKSPPDPVKVVLPEPKPAPASPKGDDEKKNPKPGSPVQKKYGEGTMPF